MPRGELSFGDRELLQALVDGGGLAKTAHYFRVSRDTLRAAIRGDRLNGVTVGVIELRLRVLTAESSVDE